MPEERPSPSARAKPASSPLARAAPVTTVPATTVPATTLRAVPAPVPSRQPEPPAEPEPEGDSAADERTRVGPVDGRWEVDNEILSSAYPAYRGLRLGYDITLRQNGRRISGEGRKVSENGAPLPPPRRTPILVTGERRGRVLRLTFMEQGAERNTAGVLQWRLAGDGTSVAGTFVSDVAGTRGSSRARRVASAAQRR